MSATIIPIRGAAGDGPKLPGKPSRTGKPRARIPSAGELSARLQNERQRLWRAAGIAAVVSRLLRDSVGKHSGVDPNLAESAGQALLAAEDIIYRSTGNMEPETFLDVSGELYKTVDESVE